MLRLSSLRSCGGPVGPSLPAQGSPALSKHPHRCPCSPTPCLARARAPAPLCRSSCAWACTCWRPAGAGACEATGGSSRPGFASACAARVPGTTALAPQGFRLLRAPPALDQRQPAASLHSAHRCPPSRLWRPPLRLQSTGRPAGDRAGGRRAQPRQCRGDHGWDPALDDNPGQPCGCSRGSRGGVMLPVGRPPWPEGCQTAPLLTSVRSFNRLLFSYSRKRLLLSATAAGWLSAGCQCASWSPMNCPAALFYSRQATLFSASGVSYAAAARRGRSTGRASRVGSPRPAQPTRADRRGRRSPRGSGDIHVGRPPTRALRILLSRNRAPACSNERFARLGAAPLRASSSRSCSRRGDWGAPSGVRVSSSGKQSLKVAARGSPWLAD